MPHCYRRRKTPKVEFSSAALSAGIVGLSVRSAGRVCGMDYNQGPNESTVELHLRPLFGVERCRSRPPKPDARDSSNQWDGPLHLVGIAEPATPIRFLCSRPN